jgi:hypothetical protein
VGAELFNAEGQTNMTKLPIVAFRSFVKAPENLMVYWPWPDNWTWQSGGYKLAASGKPTNLNTVGCTRIRRANFKTVHEINTTSSSGLLLCPIKKWS